MNKEELKLSLENIGLEVSEEKLNLLELFMMETLKANESFNLTAIKDESKFRELMILDSAYPLKYFNFDNKKVIDVGTGAGYPGMVLATLSKGEFTLLDSTRKKVDFYANFASKNKYFNVNPVCDRAESYAKRHRDIYDFATARAVADLSVLIELIVPMLKVNGYFIALKGKNAYSEIESAQKTLKKLGAVIEKIDEYELPESKEKRINIIIKKIESTQARYPREYSQIVRDKLS